jgi:hypothetical protein
MIKSPLKSQGAFGFVKNLDLQSTRVRYAGLI